MVKAVSVHMRADASRGQKRALYSLALEFQAVVSLLVAFGKQKDRKQQQLRQGHTSDGPASSYHTPLQSFHSLLVAPQVLRSL